MAVKKISNLDKDMMKNVDNYEDRIQTIEDFMLMVRQTPGMYIGPRGWAGFLNMIREVFQNALDQLLDPESPCNHISIHYDETTETIIVEDNGLGIPFNAIIRVFTKDHTSKNYVKKPGEYSAGLNGVGAKAANALSEYFCVQSYHYSGEAKQVEFSKGKVIGKGLKSIPNKNHKQGTIVIFRPDHEIMQDTQFPYQILYDLVKRMVSLTKIGTVVDFSAVDINNNKYSERIVNEDGIITDLIMKMKSPIIKPIIISEDTGEKKVDMAFCFDSSTLEGENITSFANLCPTSNSSTHVKGFLNGVCYWFVDYMNKIYLGPKTKIKIISSDIKAGLNAMIAGNHLYPDFTGQAKELLSNPDMEPFVKNVVIKGLDEWSKNNPQDLQKLCKFFKDVAEIRQKSDNVKVKITTKYSNALTGLPSKYRKASEIDEELIIVEGDSAGGTAKIGRKVETQGIFPIRGKIINAFTSSMKDLLNNEEVKGLINIIGAGYGKSFDITKVKFKKIIFMADADPDGAHINALLLRLFLVLFPGLIESGRVYKAVPPLYGIKKTGSNGKKTTTYFTERIDYVRYLQSIFNQTNTIEDLSGKKLPNAKALNLLLKNVDYTYDMECIANRYALDPCLIEMVLINYNNNWTTAKLRKTIQANYRFMDLKKEGNAITIEGLVGNKYNTLFFNDKFIKDCEILICYIKDNNDMYYKLNGEVVSLYTLMKQFEKSSPKGLTRYKGLGEMNGAQLSESTLHPDSNRTLIRLVTDDIKKDVEIIRNYESDKKRLLKFVGKVSRTDLLG